MLGEAILFIALILGGLILIYLGLVRLENIYLQALSISTGTLAIAFLLLLSTIVGGYPMLIAGTVLLWPSVIVNQVFKSIFGELIFTPDNSLGYFLYAVTQYIGYLGLLFAIRYFKGRNRKRKTLTQ